MAGAAGAKACRRRRERSGLGSVGFNPVTLALPLKTMTTTVKQADLIESIAAAALQYIGLPD
jgi:hypothetical protein